MKAFRIVGAVILGAFIIIQFIRPDRTAGPAGGESHVSARFPVSPEVGTILANSCYDCHSNATKYPWYSEVQPIGWWLQSHIEDGRRELNFDEFLSYGLPRQFRKFQEIESEVREELMPLPSYLPMHPEARLTLEHRQLLTSWSQALRDSMRAWYPEDSLTRRRSEPAFQSAPQENPQ